jgi:putative photosynthetic complex assembly protein
MTSRATGNDAIPRNLIVAAGALILLSLAAVAAVRLLGLDIHSPDSPAAQTRALRFLDGPDGSIAVYDVQTGTMIREIRGESGFVRGTLRALARERKMRSLAPEEPFLLIARTDGRLTLEDPATGKRVDLESFGPTNAAEFARLLDPTPTVR